MEDRLGGTGGGKTSREGLDRPGERPEERLWSKAVGWGYRTDVESRVTSKERAVDAWREELWWEVWICVRSALGTSCHWKREFGLEKRLGTEMSLRKLLCGVGT